MNEQRRPVEFFFAVRDLKPTSIGPSAQAQQTKKFASFSVNFIWQLFKPDGSGSPGHTLGLAQAKNSLWGCLRAKKFALGLAQDKKFAVGLAQGNKIRFRAGSGRKNSL